ncbi:hypothetical protein BJ170DRAFT_599237 [Xylariales sp. AK1849]|nr:hypothetical protein BJ170DRAFT_599237 [Xylariales sp. AK1849]
MSVRDRSAFALGISLQMYQPLSELEGYEDDKSVLLQCLKEECNSLEENQASTPRSRISLSWTPRLEINISGFIVLILLLIPAWAVMASIERNTDLRKEAPGGKSAESPISDQVDLLFAPRYINLRLYPNPSDPGILETYTGRPSKETDQAWERISEGILFGISADDVRKAGKDPERAVKMNPSWNQGDSDQYLAEIDVFHQIHCLNALRKALVTNYDYYWGRRYGFEPPAMFETHM